MNRSIHCFAIVLSTVLAPTPPAAAALVSENGPFGAGTHTRDTQTDLVWLDLTVSAGYSHTQMLAALGPGGDFEGYRFATGAEVATLFTHAGIDLGAGSAFVPQNYAPVVALTALIGLLGNNGNCGNGCTFSFTTGYTDDPPPYPGLFAIANLAYFDNSAPLSNEYPAAPIGRAYLNGGTSDSPSPAVGSFLVVPEPDAIAAGSAAVLAFAAVAGAARYRARRGVAR